MESTGNLNQTIQKIYKGKYAFHAQYLKSKRLHTQAILHKTKSGHVQNTGYFSMLPEKPLPAEVSKHVVHRVETGSLHKKFSQHTVCVFLLIFFGTILNKIKGREQEVHQIRRRRRNGAQSLALSPQRNRELREGDNEDQDDDDVDDGGCLHLFSMSVCSCSTRSRASDSTALASCLSAISGNLQIFVVN